MPLSIKDDQTDELARRLAALTGETITTAVKEARASGSSARVPPWESRPGRAPDGDRPAHSLDHGDLLYDEQGLPK